MSTRSAGAILLAFCFVVGPLVPTAAASHTTVEMGVVPAFTNITLTAGLGTPNTALSPNQARAEEIAAFINGGKGAAWFDYDRDGWQDVIITGVHKREVYRNSGDETFTDVTNATGLHGRNYGMGVITPDWNNDGLPDVIVANWYDRCEIFLNNGNGTFRNMTTFWNFLFQGPSAGLAYGDLDGDGWGDLYIGSYYKRPPGLFRNLGGNGIQEMTVQAGLKNLTAHTFQPLIFDYDNDGDLDIFESNDFGPDSMYRNEGNWVFTDVSEGLGIAINAGDGMGAAIGDVNDDGYQDIFVTNFGPDYWFVYDPVAGNYTDQHHLMNLTDNDVGWGVETMDFNNDGYLDVFVADGRVIAGQLAQPDKLYINRGDNTFFEAGGPAGVRDTGINHGSAAADFNKDGTLDLWVSNVLANSSLYRNEANANHWLQVALQGVVSPRDAVGARLTAEVAGRSMTRVVHMGSSYLSQDSMIQHFGLGDAAQVDRLTVIWPSGAVQVFTNVPADQILSVVEYEDIAPVAVAADLSADAGVPLTLDGRGSTDNTKIVEWTWTFAPPYESAMLSGPLTTITFYEPMTFNGTLTVRDGFGNAAATNFTVTIRPAGHPLVYAGPDISVAQGATVAFTAVLKGPAVPPDYANTTFNWTITSDAGTTVLPGRNVSQAFPVPDVYQVVLTGIDPFGQVGSDEMVLTVGDNLPPIVVFTPPQSVPEDTPFTLDASASYDNDPTFGSTGLFYWRLQGAAGQFEVRTGPSADFTLRDPGPAQFDLEVNDSSRNLVTLSFVIQAVDGTPPVADGGSDRVTSAGSRVRLDGSNSWDNDPGLIEHGTFEWTYNGPDGAGRAFGPITEIVVSNPGVTNVRLNVRDPSGNAARSDAEFNITAVDTTRPRLQPQPNLVVAYGEEVTFALVGATDNDPSFPQTGRFTWSFSDGNLTRTLTGASVSYSFARLGSWPVALIAADAAGNYERTNFTVTVQDQVPPTLSASVATHAIVGEPIVLDASNCTDDVGVVAFLWSINSSAGLEVVNGQHLRWTFRTPGNYTVTLTISDAAGHTLAQVFPVEVEEITAPPLPDPDPGTPTPAGGPADSGIGTFAALAVALGAALGAAAVLMLRRRQQGQA